MNCQVLNYSFYENRKVVLILPNLAFMCRLISTASLIYVTRSENLSL